MALLLALQPHFPSLSVDDASKALSIPDLRAALGDFSSGRSYTARNGHHLASPDCPLPFSHIHAWHKLRIQQRSVQNPLSLRPAQTIQAVPPSPALPFGRANTVLISHESGELFSAESDKRYLVAQVRAILQPITDPSSPPLIYVEFFKFSSAHFVVVDDTRIVAPAPKIEMFVVHHHLRSNDRRLGGIVQLVPNSLLPLHDYTCCFTRSENNQPMLWRSAVVLSEQFGYSYQEFLGVKVDKAASSPKERQEARARIAKYYDVDLQTDATKISLPSWQHIPVPGADEAELPSNFQPIQYFRVFKVLVQLYEHALGSSYYFNLYCKKELVGSVAVFAREDNSPCKACAVRRENQSVVRGVITIPPAIINKIIVHHSATPSEKTLDNTVNQIAQSLTGQLEDLSGNVIAFAQGGNQAPAVSADQAISKMIRPAEVTLLSSALAEHAEDDKQPVHFFDWQRHVDLFPSGWKDESKPSAPK
ncbi:hypothetical protein JVU11DRAFT_6882 [Chiua virens]|nr:hypothetical protein JVU11DRAFT_6882 [Chiua virens]